MEPSAYKLEKNECEDESEEEDDDAADQLNSHEAEIAGRQEPLFVVSKAEGNDAPEPAK